MFRVDRGYAFSKSGIVTFAFIINEIGYSIGNLRKAQQIMEKDLSVMEKMRKHYKISEKLLSNARSFIVNSKPDIEQLYPNEEKNLMIKLNEQLRHSKYFPSQIYQNRQLCLQLNLPYFFLLDGQVLLARLLQARFNTIIIQIMIFYINLLPKKGFTL